MFFIPTTNKKKHLSKFFQTKIPVNSSTNFSPIHSAHLKNVLIEHHKPFFNSQKKSRQIFTILFSHVSRPLSKQAKLQKLHHPVPILSLLANQTKYHLKKAKKDARFQKKKTKRIFNPLTAIYLLKYEFVCVYFDRSFEGPPEEDLF